MLFRITTSPLFNEAEVRAGLRDRADEEQERRGDVRAPARHYSERAICEIVWLVASEHFYNMTNLGLNIHSDMLCDIARNASSRRCA